MQDKRKEEFLLIMCSSHSKQIVMEKYKVLFICLGNICRSPAAEGIFKAKVNEKGLSDFFEIDSAGTGGYHNGDLPDKRMRQHGKRRGYNFDSISRKISINDFDDFDVIVTMDDSNWNNVLRLAPDLESEKKVHKMVEYFSQYQYDHIPDPYYQGAEGFELVIDLLEDACEGLLADLEKNIKK